MLGATDLLILPFHSREAEARTESAILPRVTWHLWGTVRGHPRLHSTQWSIAVPGRWLRTSPKDQWETAAPRAGGRDPETPNPTQPPTGLRSRARPAPLRCPASPGLERLESQRPPGSASLGGWLPRAQHLGPCGWEATRADPGLTLLPGHPATPAHHIHQHSSRDLSFPSHSQTPEAHDFLKTRQWTRRVGSVSKPWKG